MADQRWQTLTKGTRWWIFAAFTLVAAIYPLAMIERSRRDDASSSADFQSVPFEAILEQGLASTTSCLQGGDCDVDQQLVCVDFNDAAWTLTWFSTHAPTFVSFVELCLEWNNTMRTHSSGSQADVDTIRAMANGTLPSDLRSELMIARANARKQTHDDLLWSRVAGWAWKLAAVAWLGCVGFAVMWQMRDSVSAAKQPGPASHS